jgi:hypothetical protein
MNEDDLYLESIYKKEEFELSEEDKIKIIKRSKLDPIWFIEHFLFIDGDKSKPFKLFQYQKNFIKTVLDNKFVIINKGRQLGMSQASGALVLWVAMFHKSKEVVIISINDREAVYFKEKRCELVFEAIPSWIGGRLKEQNAHQMTFDTNSSIEAMANTPRALRGRSPSFVIMDEFAFFGSGEKSDSAKKSLLTSALPALNVSGEHIVLISTPNGTAGIGQEFYNLWTGATSKENDWTPFEIHWWECPMYNTDPDLKYVDWKENAWAVKQSKNYPDITAFKQEILGEWIMSGDTVIPTEYLEKLIPRNVLRTDFLKEVDVTPEDVYALKDGFDEAFDYIKGLWIWEEPVPGHYYIMGGDTSTGRAADYSTLEIIDINTSRQVAEWRARVPHNFLYPIYLKIAKYYNDAFIVTETNSTEEVVNKLIDGGYDNVYHREHGRKLVPGWYTDTRTRPLLVSNLQDVVMKGKVEINSSRLISELKTFVWENGKAQAAKKSNDDLIFGFMIADYTTESFVNNQSIGVNIKRFADKEVDIKSMSIGILSDSIESPANGDYMSSSDYRERGLSEISSQELADNYEIDDSNFDFLGIPRIKKPE